MSRPVYLSYRYKLFVISWYCLTSDPHIKHYNMMLFLEVCLYDTGST